ncbi:glycosyltransferase [Devosia sp. RR2S18]|uniref:glycosyltransferase n=1 Tax=Devosia rhizosphaerae TaxID=3049774 RepID=UPI002542429D|nr:glycosyltransferase [Devosia sp. RR2S18]WIJ25157.1 glycosyltransferase [Devosia sp. RR2S18]
MTLPTIVSFWHGPMSWLERISIASFVRHGHQVEVYSYEPIPDLPTEAVQRDAAEILPRSKLVFYKGKGTPGVFSDYFRMSLLRHARGVYADLDMYCVRPIAPASDYLMAYERPGSVNGAVLLIPPEAPLLADLLAIFEQSRRPLLEPHLPPIRRLEVAARRLVGDPVRPEHMQYGATGPMALTYYVRHHGLGHLVLPSASFYPIPYEGIPGLLQPGSSIDPAIRPETMAVHIWRSQLTNRGRAGIAPPPADSALAELCAREGVS